VKILSVLEKAKELYLAIRESQELKNFQEAKEILLANPEAKERMEKYLQLIEKANQAEKENRDLSLEEKDELKKLASIIAFYLETARFAATQQDYYRLIQQILTIIRAASDNKPLPDCEESKGKSSQCTGSCRDCGLG